MRGRGSIGYISFFLKCNYNNPTPCTVRRATVHPFIMPIEASQLILNDDGSVYHLHLRPEQIAQTIFTVGDPDRVSQISKYFDRIEYSIQKREFITHTGYIGKRRLSVLSTGIGTDNLDIVMNELDALVNIDLATRTPKTQLTSLRLIRVGTSGCLHPDMDIDSFLVSRYAVGLDNLLHFYRRDLHADEAALQRDWQDYFQARGFQFPVRPYFAQAHQPWVDDLVRRGWQTGITLTAPGFYAPQMRQLRAPLAMGDFFNESADFRFNNLPVTNFEMETSALYAFGSLLGHQTLSLNALVAHRRRGQFSAQPLETVERLIQKTLEWVESGAVD